MSCASHALILGLVFNMAASGSHRTLQAATTTKPAEGLNQVVLTCTRQAEEVLALGDAAQARLHNDIRAAIEKVGAALDTNQVKAISDELGSQSRYWREMRHEEVEPDKFSQTMQALVYQRLTKPDLDDQSRQTLLVQRHELLAIMALLPKRLVKEFGVPQDLASRLVAQCQVGQDQYRLLLNYDFLRISQVPASEASHRKLKGEMEREIVRLGKALANELGNNTRRWNQRIKRRKGQLLPEELGESLPDTQYRTTRLFLTSFYGMAVRTFVHQRMLDLGTDRSLFPFGEVETYGTEYKLDVGWIFKLKLKTPPDASRPSATAP